MAHVDGHSGARGEVERALDASGEPIVKLVGEFDISNAERLGRTLDQIIDGGTGRLVIDLAALEFMDSSGIAMLLRAAANVDAVKIRNPSDVVRRIIECTGLTDILQIES